MTENVYTLNVVLPLEEGAIDLLVEVVPFMDPYFFLVKKVAFIKETSTLSFMPEFHLEKRRVAKEYQWFHKERNQHTLLAKAIGNAIDVNIKPGGSEDGNPKHH